MKASAFILAAGLGTRLAPLTDTKPKALVQCNKKPLLEHVILNLKAQGFTDFVINVHHFAPQIKNFLAKNKNFHCNIQISDESKQLLDTGGALLHAKPLLNQSENILIYNTDILSDIDIKELLQLHRTQNALASLALDQRTSDRKLLFNEQMQLCRWRNNKTQEEKIALPKEKHLKEFAFTGIHIIHKEIFKLITEQGKFSVIDLYLRLAKTQKIIGHRTPYSYWFDAGKPETLQEAEKFLQQK